MPAKKAPNSREANKRDAIRVEVPLNGLYMEKFVAFPVWDANEIEKESWGDYNPNDSQGSLYVDSESSLLGSVLFEGLENASIEWKRPAVLFSPFKPVVYRQTNLEANPYDSIDESEEGKTARDLAIANYRELRPLRAVGDEDEATARAAAAKSRVAAATAALNGGAPSGTPRRRGAAPTPVPFLMGAFQSALMILSQSQHHIQPGCFAWELIYPQAPNTQGMPVPVINPCGKYAVRLFVGGAFRKVIIDDRLPADSSGRSIFTVTDYKEIWPALLVKAIMKVLTPALEAQIALNPVVALSTLMCGWTPQVLQPTSDELLVYRMLQRVRTSTENLVVVATCSDSGATYTTGAIGSATSANLQLLAAESAQSNLLLSNPNASQIANSPNASGVGSSPEIVAMNASASGDASSSKTFSGQQENSILPNQSQNGYKAVGLRAYHAYHIVDMRSYGDGFLLRLVCPGATYTGPYSYDSDDWTQDLIDTIGFNPSEHRNSVELAKRWNDFWVPWDQFKTYFSAFIVFRYAADKKSFPYFKNFPAEVVVGAPGDNNNSNNISSAVDSLGRGGTPGSPSPPSHAPQTSNPRTNADRASKNNDKSFGNISGAGGRNQSNTISSGGIDIVLPNDVSVPKHQKNSVRWVHLVNPDADTDSAALICMTGLPTSPSVIQQAVAPPAPTTKATKASSAAAALAQQQAQATNLVVAPPSAQDTESEPQQWLVQVHRFDWNASQPFCLLKKQVCSRGLNQSFFVVLPPGRGTTLRITIENCPIGCAVGVLSSCEIFSGNEREVFLEGSGIVSGSDAGTFGDHAGPSNIASGPTPVVSNTSFATGQAALPSISISSQSSFELQGPGQYSDSAALQTATIWFKRHIMVKADTTASFVLSTLSKNADLNSHRVFPQETVAVGGKGSKSKQQQNDPNASQQNANQQNQDKQNQKGAGAAGGKNNNQKGKDANNQLGSSMIDITDDHHEHHPEPIRPISDYANLILVDVESGHTTVDTIGKILNVALAPSRLGYVLMAVARTPENYKKGNWKLSYFSTRVFDTFEARTFEDVATKTGQYVQNDFRQVFRYNFFFPATNDKGEPTGPSATIQACLRDDSGQPVPFTLELKHGVQDPIIASNAAATAAAASGGMNDTAAANGNSNRASPDSPNSKAQMAASVARSERKAKDEPPEPIPMDSVTSKSSSHYAMFEHVLLSAHEKNTPSYYSLICTLDSDYAHQWEERRKVQVIEGFKATTDKQSKLLNQQQWTRYQALKRNPGAPLPKELEQTSLVVPEVTPGNIVFTVSLHFSNAKYELKEDSSIQDALNAIKQSWGRKQAEERAATLAAQSGKKQGGSKKPNAKDEQQLSEEIAAHFARAKAARDRFLQNRKGIFLPYLSEETGQPVLDAFADPSMRFLPMAATSDYDSYKNDPHRAAEQKKTESLSSNLQHAAPVQYAKKLAEHTIETTAGLRASRKTWISHVNDTLGAHWAEVAPNKPVNGVNANQEEQDDKNKRRGGVGANRTVGRR